MWHWHDFYLSPAPAAPDDTCYSVSVGSAALKTLWHQAARTVSATSEQQVGGHTDVSQTSALKHFYYNISVGLMNYYTLHMWGNGWFGAAVSGCVAIDFTASEVVSDFVSGFLLLVILSISLGANMFSTLLSANQIQPGSWTRTSEEPNRHTYCKSDIWRTNGNFLYKFRLGSTR